MNATTDQLVFGFSIIAHKERVSSIGSRFHSGNEPAMVCIHRLGSVERSWLTPDEARRLARVLEAAAEVAEGKPTP